METVKNICNKYDIKYDIEMEQYAKEIIDIMNGHMNTTDNGFLLRWNGIYCEVITKDYEIMKKYYLMAIDHGDTKAMYNLGLYYHDTELNYILMEKYYLMAIKHGDVRAMYNLGYYYDIKENYTMMKKYYIMAIEHGKIEAMHNLGYYYNFNEKNYVLMEKYYLMAIKNYCTKTMNNLALYYYLIKDYNISKKYFHMAITCGDITITKHKNKKSYIYNIYVL